MEAMHGNLAKQSECSQKDCCRVYSFPDGANIEKGLSTEWLESRGVRLAEEQKEKSIFVEHFSAWSLGLAMVFCLLCFLFIGLPSLREAGQPTIVPPAEVHLRRVVRQPVHELNRAQGVENLTRKERALLAIGLTVIGQRAAGENSGASRGRSAARSK